MWLDVCLLTIDLSASAENWHFTVPFCSCSQERHSVCATWKCQIRARLGKRKSTSYPWSLKRERNFGRMNGLHAFISLHVLCTSCFACFWCPHLNFCTRNFDEYPPLKLGSQNNCQTEKKKKKRNAQLNLNWRTNKQTNKHTGTVDIYSTSLTCTEQRPTTQPTMSPQWPEISLYTSL